MVELRILGPPRITTSDGRRADSLTRRSKRTALLAYLAYAAPRGPHRRDKLLALFWPESDLSHARAALSQALYVLRRALGDAAVTSAGDEEVALDPDVVWCDAVAFDQQLDAGRPAEALALYRADLLDGFFVAGAPEFDQWLDRERERLRGRVSEGAWTLATAAAAEGKTIEAARWARQAADVVPADEAVARRLMTFLHDLGDRAAAVRAYEAFAWRLAHEYELEPSAETRSLAERIRADGRESSAPAPVSAAVAPVAARPAGSTRRPRWIRSLAVAGAVTLLAAVTWRSLHRAGSPRSPLMEFPLDFAAAPPLASGAPGPMIALSPDGQHLVYVGAAGQNTALFLRRMGGLETIPIPHSNRARLPFFSPDGEWLGFTVGDTIRKVRLGEDAGPAFTVASAAGPIMGASWGPGDLVVFASPAGLWKVSATGGIPTILAPAGPPPRAAYRWPEVLPDGHTVLATQVDASGFHLVAVRLASGTVTPLGLKGTSPRFVAPAHLVFAQMDGALMAIRFDVERLRIAGEVRRIAERVFVGAGGAAKAGVSGTGALAYVPERADRTLVLVDRTGRPVDVPVPPQAFGDARFSPDGRRLAVTVKALDTEQQDIWILDLGSPTMRRVTADSGSVTPVWTPDGGRLVVASNPGARGVGYALRSIVIGRAGAVRTLMPGEPGQLSMAITPEGRDLLFQRIHPDTRRDIWVLPLDGADGARPYLDGPADERAPAVSPDGRWVAYGSDESGRQEVYLAGFPDPATRRRVSSGGGWEPRWASQGHELFYRTARGMVVVALETAPQLRIGAPRVLFDDAAYLSWFNNAAYDVAPDGQRFAMIRRGADSRSIVIVLNWLERLRAAER